MGRKDSEPALDVTAAAWDVCGGGRRRLYRESVAGFAAFGEQETLIGAEDHATACPVFDRVASTDLAGERKPRVRGLDRTLVDGEAGVCRFGEKEGEVGDHRRVGLFQDDPVGSGEIDVGVRGVFETQGEAVECGVFLKFWEAHPKADAADRAARFHDKAGRGCRDRAWKSCKEAEKGKKKESAEGSCRGHRRGFIQEKKRHKPKEEAGAKGVFCKRQGNCRLKRGSAKNDLLLNARALAETLEMAEYT